VKYVFEADFRMSAQVRNDGPEQRVFRLIRREPPANDAKFLSLLVALYLEEVYTLLLPGDDLTVAVRLDLPPREVQRTVQLREDRLFGGEGLLKPTADLLPAMRAFYEPFLQRVKPGDVFTLTFCVQHT
jgi:hypothetical protein